MVQHHFSLHLEMATQTLLLFYWRLVLTPVSQHLMVALLCGWLHMEATRRYCNSWFDIILVNVQQPQSPWISWHHCILDSTELKISCYSNLKLYMMYTPRTQTTHTLEDLTHRNVSRSTPPRKKGVLTEAFGRRFGSSQTSTLGARCGDGCGCSRLMWLTRTLKELRGETSFSNIVQDCCRWCAAEGSKSIKIQDIFSFFFTIFWFLMLYVAGFDSKFCQALKMSWKL